MKLVLPHRAVAKAAMARRRPRPPLLRGREFPLFSSFEGDESILTKHVANNIKIRVISVKSIFRLYAPLLFQSSFSVKESFDFLLLMGGTPL